MESVQSCVQWWALFIVKILLLEIRLISRFVCSVIQQWHYSPLLGPGPFFSSVIFFTQTVRPLGRVTSPSQGRYSSEQHKHRINAHTDIHALKGIRTHDPSLRASEDGSCFWQCGYCDQLISTLFTQNYWVFGFRPPFGILKKKTRERNFSKTGSISVFRWG
jgi:hypothetical protein